MREVNIGPASEFSDPGRKVIAFENFEVGVFKLGGEFFAYLNHCPHMGGPACQGKIMPKVDEVIAADRTWELSDLLALRRERVSETVRTVVESADFSHLAAPGLDVLKSDLTRAINNTLQTRIVKSVAFTDFSLEAG